MTFKTKGKIYKMKMAPTLQDHGLLSPVREESVFSPAYSTQQDIISPQNLAFNSQ